VSAPFGGIEKARARVAWLWRELWSWHNSPRHIPTAQFELELKLGGRAGAEKGWRA
jgi:hypothetical protein